MADLTKTLNDEFSSGSSSGNFSSGGSTGFEGWLLKFGSREFPMECIAEEGDCEKKFHIKYGVKTLSGRNIPVGFLVSEKQYIGVRYILTNGVQ